MFIQSVEINGFKSFGCRTEINGFDPKFNVITGLNGTGKTNIIDAIIFVMGSNNFPLLRVDLLQDLLFEVGSDAMDTATVTIIFDNTNSMQRPLGYEKWTEITITRKISMSGESEHQINGKCVQITEVLDFFRSIQMNVNVPSFLIKQGHIKEVLKMPPQELLSLIKETAGIELNSSNLKILHNMLCINRNQNHVDLRSIEQGKEEIGALTKEDDEPFTIRYQLRAVQQQLSRAQIAIQIFENQSRHFRTLENEPEPTATNKKLEDQLKVDVKNIQCRVLKRIHELMRTLSEMKEELDHSNTNHDLFYRNPKPNFDPGKVIGMVAKLFTVIDPQHLMALMVAGGDALYHYVVEDKSALLRGQLQRRVTVISINTLELRPNDTCAIECAQRLVGKENAIHALSAIVYDRQVDAVMHLVFGNTIICPTVDIATKIAFHPDINCRCVTLDGHCVNSDGSINSSDSHKIQELLNDKINEMQLEKITNGLQQLKDTLETKSSKSWSSAYNNLTEELRLRRKELNICEDRLGQLREHLDFIARLEESMDAIKKKNQGTKEIRRNEIGRELKAKNCLQNLVERKGILQTKIENISEDLESTEKHFQELAEYLFKLRSALQDLNNSNSNATDLDKEDALKQSINEQYLKIASKQEDILYLVQRKERLEKNYKFLTLDVKVQENRVVEIKYGQLNKIWQMVKKDYRTILSALLRNDNEMSNSPLLQGDQLLSLENIDGLYGIWKDSLDEISGGQRSLVALALLFALFKVSPAPIYLLDNLDSDFDSLRTTNIVDILKELFPSSQLIIVSLNSFMINESKNIFCTTLVDDMTTVTHRVKQ